MVSLMGYEWLNQDYSFVCVDLERCWDLPNTSLSRSPSIPPDTRNIFLFCFSHCLHKWVRYSRLFLFYFFKSYCCLIFISMRLCLHVVCFESNYLLVVSRSNAEILPLFLNDDDDCVIIIMVVVFKLLDSSSSYY